MSSLYSENSNISNISAAYWKLKLGTVPNRIMKKRLGEIEKEFARFIAIDEEVYLNVPLCTFMNFNVDTLKSCRHWTSDLTILERISVLRRRLIYYDSFEDYPQTMRRLWTLEATFEEILDFRVEEHHETSEATRRMWKMPIKINSPVSPDRVVALSGRLSKGRDRQCIRFGVIFI